MMNKGYYSQFGGAFLPEILVATFDELRAAFEAAKSDPDFWDQYREIMITYSCRPTPVTFAENLSRHLGGARIYLKREDLCHTGAHKINNALGQVLLARRMGKQRVIAETGAGQHGVATATMAAKFGLECVVYMGRVDMERQALNVTRMRMLGATVVPVTAGQETLKEAISEAMRDWVTHVRSTHYVLGTAFGAHPYPLMVREFQSVIGREARAQILRRERRLPDLLVACVGGGSNAIGLFHAFVGDPKVRLVGVEAGGLGIRPGRHAARFAGGRLGVLQGARTLVLQDADGQIQDTHSVSAGLDYAAVGPEHVWLRDQGRASYDYVTDTEAVAGFDVLARLEGILPALESSHAIAWLMREAPRMKKRDIVVANLSGRGDKDGQQITDWKSRQ